MLASTDWAALLPRVNAAFNALSASCLVVAYVAIRRRQVRRHRFWMLAALSSSALFLVGYLTRVTLYGSHRFPGGGGWKAAYLLLLGSHMLLAVAMLPMIFTALYLAWHRRFAAHRRLARWTWPIWLYVSLTGVMVYAALYHLAPRLAPAAARSPQIGAAGGRRPSLAGPWRTTASP